MTLDPQVVLYLNKRAARGLPPTHTQTPDQHRAFLDRGPFAQGPAVESFAEVAIPCAGGHEIAARIYVPNASPDLPVLVFFHGGGWVCGNLESIDGSMRHLALASGHIVVASAYRRAPEHKFPQPLDDCFRAVEWAVENIKRWGGDSARLSIGGSSAGGNLAAAVCLRWRDEERVPAICTQVLVYPCLDPACDTQSYVTNATGYVLTTPGMKWYWNHYLRDETDRGQAYACPLMAPSLSGLPPTLMLTGGYDPLLDDGRRYADALEAASVKVTYREYPGMVHGFFNQWNEIDMGLQSIRDTGAWLAAR